MFLFRLKFIEEKSDIILIGPSGLGKTHLAIALGVVFCQGGYTSCILSFQNLDENLHKAEEHNRLRCKLLTYCKPHVLIIDELGYLLLN